MKKTLLFITCLAFFAYTQAQNCTPDPQYTIEDFGVWPAPDSSDTDVNVTPLGEGVVNDSTGIPPACQNEAFDFFFTIVVPDSLDAEDVYELSDGALNQDLDLNRVKVNNVTGLPTGYTFDPDYDFLYQDDNIYCATITGTTTDAPGRYILSIEATAWVNLGFFPFEDFEQAANFDGYFIDVLNCTGINDIPEQLNLFQNVPNPFNGITEITFQSPKSANATFEVHNLIGKRVVSKNLPLIAGNNFVKFDASSLPSGIYLYSIVSGQDRVTKRMIVK